LFPSFSACNNTLNPKAEKSWHLKKNTEPQKRLKSLGIEGQPSAERLSGDFDPWRGKTEGSNL
jgi:hypothetical protein